MDFSAITLYLTMEVKSSSPTTVTYVLDRHTPKEQFTTSVRGLVQLYESLNSGVSQL
jgi:hypothetical protein